MTREQSRALRLSLASLGHAVLHHGDAVGADAEAHEQAVALGWSVIIHPPINEAWRARKAASEERAPKPYLVRNRDIVDETELLVAALADAVEHPQSEGSGLPLPAEFVLQAGTIFPYFRQISAASEYGPELRCG
jgi:hypothetical protein